MTALNANLPENQTKIMGVIFDLGGVILRTDDPAPRELLAERMGKTRQELEDIVFGNPAALLAEEGKATRAEVWESVRMALALKPEEVKPFRRAFFDGDHVDFKMIGWLQSLRPIYRTALLSNTWFVDLPGFIRDDLSIPENTFDVIISSAQLGIAKPKAAIYQETLKRLNLEPSQVVFVDDNDRNIEGARKVGLQVIRFYNPEQTHKALSQMVNLP